MCHTYSHHVRYFFSTHKGGKIVSGKKVRCIICYTPLGTKPGAYKLAVSLSKGPIDFSSNTKNYIYYKNPTLIKISPRFGKITGGTNITIHGKNFENFPNYLQCSFSIHFVMAIYVNSNTIICK